MISFISTQKQKMKKIKSYFFSGLKATHPLPLAIQLLLPFNHFLL